MTALALDDSRQRFTWGVNTGSSTVSKRLEKSRNAKISYFRRRPEREGAFSELTSVVEIGSKDNWDQYGAAKVDRRTQELAYLFLIGLPTAIPAPEVGLDPDGEILFEWFVSPRKQFSVSLSPEGRLSFAGSFGINSTLHGTEGFDGTVPQAIISAIHRLGISR